MDGGKAAEAENLAITVATAVRFSAAAVRFAPTTIVCTIPAAAAVFCLQGGNRETRGIASKARWSLSVQCFMGVFGRVYPNADPGILSECFTYPTVG